MVEEEEKRRRDGQPKASELSRASGSSPKTLVPARNSQPRKCLRATRARVKLKSTPRGSLASLRLSQHAFSSFLAKEQIRLIG